MIRTVEFDDMTREERTVFTVVHPLNDIPEEKLGAEHLGRMAITRTARVCLFLLRGYLLLMFALLAYRVLQLAGVIHG